ncbi:MAG: SDR family oxidoreductase [Clostridiales Family XIII bacterium]|nr:SDR family oxidoreductase [Clostridiales Family XIII bacterium]
MFQGKNVLITGATGGIGSATAKAFADAGANLALQSTSPEKLERLTDALALPDGRVAGFVLDIGDEASVADMIRRASAQFGSIDVLVNNAGRLSDATPVIELTEEAMLGILRVNLLGPFFATKHALRQMKDQGHGSIVTVASTAGIYASPLLPYVAAKHALIGFMKNVALEAISYGVRLNIVAPGAVDTPMMDAAAASAGFGEDIPAFRAMVEGGIPDGRYAKPEEVAEAIFWFASEKSAHTVGQVLVVDGGEYV